MRSDPRHLLVLGGVSFLGLGLHHVGLLREVLVIGALSAAAAVVLSFPGRLE